MLYIHRLYEMKGILSLYLVSNLQTYIVRIIFRYRQRAIHLQLDRYGNI